MHDHPDLTTNQQRLSVTPNSNGMVTITLEDQAVQGTWMDALDLSLAIHMAAITAARNINVSRETIIRHIIQ